MSIVKHFIFIVLFLAAIVLFVMQSISLMTLSSTMRRIETTLANNDNTHLQKIEALYNYFDAAVDLESTTKKLFSTRGTESGVATEQSSESNIRAAESRPSDISKGPQWTQGQDNNSFLSRQKRIEDMLQEKWSRACTQNTVAYWPFDMNLQDGCGNDALTATPEGSVDIRTDETLPLTRGLGYLELDGGPSRITINTSLLDILGELPAGTIEAWVFLDVLDLDNGNTIFNSGTPPVVTDLSMMLCKGSEGEFECMLEIDNVAVRFVLPDFQIDKWHHLACTWNSSTAECFVDGVSQGSQALTGVPRFVGEEVEIGSNDQEVSFWVGYLDEIRISNTILTPGQMLLK